MPGDSRASEATRRVECREAAGKGRGIFALAPIAEGEVFERAPVLVLPHSDNPNLDATSMADYVYVWRYPTEVGPEIYALALGYGLLYNHSYEPNALYRRSYSTSEMHYVALRDIGAGEEITINYNGRPDDRTPVWFDVAP